MHHNIVTNCQNVYCPGLNLDKVRRINIINRWLDAELGWFSLDFLQTEGSLSLSFTDNVKNIFLVLCRRQTTNNVLVCLKMMFDSRSVRPDFKLHHKLKAVLWIKHYSSLFPSEHLLRTTLERPVGNSNLLPESCACVFRFCKSKQKHWRKRLDKILIKWTRPVSCFKWLLSFSVAHHRVNKLTLNKRCE